MNKYDLSAMARVNCMVFMRDDHDDLFVLHQRA